MLTYSRYRNFCIGLSRMGVFFEHSCYGNASDMQAMSQPVTADSQARCACIHYVRSASGIGLYVDGTDVPTLPRKVEASTVESLTVMGRPLLPKLRMQI
jgi:hypothetical protein